MVVFGVIFACASLLVLIAAIAFFVTGDTHAGFVLLGVVAGGLVVVGGSSVAGHKLGRF